MADVGELERIAHEVDEDLQQPRPVCNQIVGNIVGHADSELEMPIARLNGERLQPALERAAEREGLGIEINPSGFDLGQVEDVVDDAEQRQARLVNQHQVLALVVG